MVHFETFGVEAWMDEWQPRCEWDLAETCCSSLTVQEVLNFANADLSELPNRRLVYGDIRGSERLRKNIASLYEGSKSITDEHVLVTQGAIGANFLVLLTLIAAGSVVIVAHPTYQQLYDTPKAFGADVRLWRQDPERGWRHDIDVLESLLTPDTSLVVINNPKNPTGTHIEEAELQAIVKAVQAHASPECVILSDEVYSPLYHSLPQGGRPPSSMLTVAERLGFHNVVATGSLSKAWALAGLRVGWIASLRLDLIDRFARTRDYNVISVSGLDDYMAGMALEPATRQKILKNNTALAQHNRGLLVSFLERVGLHWVPTTAGTTAFIKLPAGTDDVDFCRRLAETEKVLLCPGTYFDWPGWVRLGYVNRTAEIATGLAKLEAFLKSP